MTVDAIPARVTIEPTRFAEAWVIYQVSDYSLGEFSAVNKD